MPTLRGCLFLFVPFVAVLILGLRNMNAFLTVNAPEPGGVFVVDGWAPDYALETAMLKSQASVSQKLYVVGVPLEHGGPLSEYKTYAELGAAILLRMGVSSNALQAVPTTYVRKDRTYATALDLKNWLRQHGGIPKEINLVTVGAHARRCRFMWSCT
jgi:hypothetical protein